MTPIDSRLSSARTEVGYNRDVPGSWKRHSEKQYRRQSRRYARDLCHGQLAEMYEDERRDRELEEEARLEAQRYRALHAVETLHEELSAARSRFYKTIEDHSLDDWIDYDIFGDYHSVRTVEEVREKRD